MKTKLVLLPLAAFMLAAAFAQAQTPTAPTLVTATASFYYVPDIYLTWRGSDNSVGTETYRIYRSLGDTSHFELVGSSYYSVYADYQILGGQMYYYYITSSVVRDTTRYESQPSSFVNAIAIQQGGGGGGGGSKRKNNGTIAGRVMDQLTTKPISAVQVIFYRVSSPGVPVQKVLTDGSGHYKAALDTGTYVFKAQAPLSGGSPAYLPEWYQNAWELSLAARVHVDDSSRIVADFELAKPDTSNLVAVSGTVMDSNGVPLKWARVAIMRSIQSMEDQSSSDEGVTGVGKESCDLEGVGHAQGVVWQGTVDSSGNYQGRIPAGGSYVVLAARQGYKPQFFFEQSNPSMANLLQLNHDTSGIDFNLRTINSAEVFGVGGTVHDSNGVRVPSRVVLIPVGGKADDSSVLFTFTDSVGNFTVSHVRSGNYIALALPFSLYAPAYYRAAAFGTMRWQEADTIVVTGDVNGINIGVSRIIIGGINRVSGRITSSGESARGVNVYARFANGSIAGHGLSDDNGYYSLNGLPSETLSLSTDLEGFQASHSTLTISPGSLSTNGVDFTLASSVVSSVAGADGVAREFAVEQNYPNPFNPLTIIKYTVGGTGGLWPGVSKIRLVVYDLLGREVATLVNENKAAGTYEVRFDGSALASGVYLYRLTAGTLVQSKKMLLVK